MGGSDSLAPPAMVATQEEMDNAKLPMAYRDYCAHLLIPLNECRRANFFWPGTCGHEHHAYEKCMYKEYVRRTKLAAREAAQ